MPRYFIFLQYNGSGYHGWQLQPNAVTVQQVLEEKLSVLLREKIETTGAGRTDTGVHAREYAAHFDSSSPVLGNVDQFLYKINCLLPYDISVSGLTRVHNEAHARFDAISRSYEYHLTVAKDPFLKDFAYYYPWNLNVEQMNQAAAKLFEYSDFTSFSKLHTDVKTNNCKILEAGWTRDQQKLIFTITADRFLRNMVRAIVGTMLEVGKEKLSPDDFCRIVERKNRSSAGISVPAHGLYLLKIIYPDGLFY